jgi:PPOX class probable F420-dependent enzyme
MGAAHRFNRFMASIYDRMRSARAFEAIAWADGVDGDLAALRGQTYVNLVTFRRSGEPVPSPVWCAIDTEGRAYVRTAVDTGKVKRLRHDPRVLLRASTMRGLPRGPAYRGNGRLLTPDEWPHAEQVLVDAYGLGRKLYESVAGEGAGTVAYLEIRPVDAPGEV